MQILLCDNIECRKQLKESEINTVIVNHRGEELKFDLCDECYNNIINSILHNNNNNNNNNNVITDEQIKQEEKSGTKVKRRKTIAIINAYGADKVVDEYINGDISIKDLAKKVGISDKALKNYMNKCGVVKDKKSNLKNINSSTNEDDKYLNIDKKRFDKEFKQKLFENEEKTTDLPKACRTCAYRNMENNHCWYTMVTNSQARNTETECNHYVDIRKIEND